MPRAADALYIMIHRTHCAATQKCILPVAQEIEAFLAWNLTKHKRVFLVTTAGIGRAVLAAKLFATLRSHANIVSSTALCSTIYTLPTSSLPPSLPPSLLIGKALSFRSWETAIFFLSGTVGFATGREQSGFSEGLETISMFAP